MAARKNGGRGPSIRDVSNCAGVSVSTVSRYLNNPSLVAPDKQKLISAAIKQLDYRPSVVAQAFSRGTTKSVVVLASSLRLLGPSLTLQGIEQAAAKLGYTVEILTLEDSQDFLSSLAERIRAQSPMGVILIAYDKTGQDALSFLPPSIPIVSLHGDQNNNASRQVSLATYQGGHSITEYLLSLGHQTVYHVSVPTREAGLGRLEGWRDALLSHHTYAPAPLEASWNPISGYEIGKRLAKKSSCTAIFAGNDEIAMGLIAGLSSEGKNVPYDVSVAGLDDHPLSVVSIPPLTTYHLHFESAGAAAFNMLLTQGTTRENILKLPGNLIVRSSTAAPH